MIGASSLCCLSTVHARQRHSAMVLPTSPRRKTPCTSTLPERPCRDSGSDSGRGRGRGIPSIHDSIAATVPSPGDQSIKQKRRAHGNPHPQEVSEVWSVMSHQESNLLMKEYVSDKQMNEQRMLNERSLVCLHVRERTAQKKSRHELKNNRIKPQQPHGVFQSGAYAPHQQYICLYYKL